MVQEVRNIILSMDEIHTAFECYQRITPEFLPKGTIISCKTMDNAVVLAVDIQYGATPQRQLLTYKGLDVIKPLIRFCIENNIMLPRDGRKSVLIEGDRIILHVELDLNMDMPTSLSPMQMKHIDKSVPGEKVAV